MNLGIDWMDLNSTGVFFATMKLVTSEEILAEVLPQNEEGTEFFVLSNPIVVAENVQIDQEKGVAMSGLVPRKWMLYANEDMTIVYKNHVVSVSEMDKFGIDFYKKALIAAKCSSPIKKKVETKNHSGYLGKVDKLRKKLEKFYDNSPDLTTD
tara:strand:+ start:1074 stop:1532 length:459 start_codon:yes stop_codon:yes gene_type:complete